MKQYDVGLYMCSLELENEWDEGTCVKICKKFNVCSYGNKTERDCDERTFKMQKFFDISKNIANRLEEEL